jgi:hypothetical protein
MNAKYLGCDDKKPPNKEVKPLFFYKQNQDLLLQKKQGRVGAFFR